jgi:hypothetical protein
MAAELAEPTGDKKERGEQVRIFERLSTDSSAHTNDTPGAGICAQITALLACSGRIIQ